MVSQHQHIPQHISIESTNRKNCVAFTPEANVMVIMKGFALDIDYQS